MKYALHFIGKSAYNEKLFIKEAKKLGVSRALPFPIAKNLYGKLLLLAFKTEEGAKVIGYTIVSGYTIPSSILTEALAKAEINPCDYKVVSGDGCAITRGCGSYVVTASVYMDNDENLQKVLEVLAEIYKEKKFKVFVNGAFYPIKSFIVQAKFTRSVTTVELNDELANVLPKNAIIQGVDEYERVLRRDWKEKDKLLTQYESKTLVSFL